MAETISTTAIYAPTSFAGAFSKSLYRPDEVLADYFRVIGWSTVMIVCFAVGWLFEIYVLQNPRRLIANPSELATRIFGFSHFTVGLLFLLSSRKMRRLESWGWFFGLLLVGILISLFFYNFGGRLNPVLLIFYFLYFMVHGFRDVVFFYKPTTDNAEVERTRAQILGLIQICLLIFLMYVLVPAYLFYRSLKPRSYSPELRAQIDSLMPYLNAILALSWLLVPVCLWAIATRVRAYPERLSGFYKDNKPILKVLLYSVLIILMSPLLGPWIFNLLILVHFVGWYFYASKRLQTLPNQSSRKDGLWKWFKESAPGFRRLHLGVAGLFFAIILIKYFVLQNSGIAETLFSANAFYYWTVVHVTISFAPRS